MQQPTEMILARRFLRMCRANRRRSKVADSSGAELDGGELLLRALILRRLLRRRVLGGDERHVGLLLPPSVGAVVANAALAVDGRIAVNLNYTLSSDVMNACLKQCEIRHVLTSRRVMEKFQHLRVKAELVYLEDLADRVTLGDKLTGMLQAKLIPLGMLERRLGLAAIQPHHVLTVIFTSGTTGLPKGVVLTQRNVSSNIDAFNAVLNLKSSDVLVGILPLFHSFGYTATLWTALTLQPKVIYHYSPREARAIGRLCRVHGATILIATPTFLRLYQRGCRAEDFAKLEVVVTGAEKLPVQVADKFEEKFGVRPVEGYGTTELSPVVSLNVPPARALDAEQTGCKEGTIGRPLPGISAKVVDLETGEDLGVGKSGMLWIKGPNVMQGYLNRPEETAQVIHDGWYETGDVAVIDEDGFITITGRRSRFSKIGGEMVPHQPIEEAIAQVLDLDEDRVSVAVVGVPDPKKGERLVVLHSGLSQAPEEICRRLGEAGLPPIYIPSPNCFRRVEEIPLTGTGKLALKRVQQLAMEQFGE